MGEFREKDGRIEPQGNQPKRLGGLLPAEREDEVITKGQITNYLNGELIEDVGAFASVDPDRAIAIQTPSGVIYLAIAIRA